MRKVLFILAFVLAAVTVYAQELEKPDLAASVQAGIVALTPIATMLLVWGLKAAWSKMPASVVFIATPVLGGVVNYGLLWLDGNAAAFSPIVGALLGWLAVSLREFLSTLTTKGLKGAVSVTAKNL